MTDKECFNIVLTINQCNSFVLENNHLTKPTIQSLSKLQLTCRSGSKKHTSFKNTTQELLKGVDKRAFCSDFWVEIMRNTTILTLDLTLVTSFTTILCSWQSCWMRAQYENGASGFSSRMSVALKTTWGWISNYPKSIMSKSQCSCLLLLPCITCYAVTTEE